MKNLTSQYNWIRCLLSICFLLISLILSSQVIKGNIKTIDGKNLPYAIVVFKDSSESNKIKEHTTARNGKCFIKLSKTYEDIIVVVSSNGYLKEYIHIKNPIKQNTYEFDLLMTNDRTVSLKEVVVRDKKPIYSKKIDTVSFSVQNYIDGSERKIEDIIAKLPGIEVNRQTGEIKYKGKSIETVTLDGDNLFGFNYTLGTKNINVDMVEQIEAIDNYAENPLLKGIEQGGKVSLNLKLKQGKIDFSGSLDFGSGWFKDGHQAFNIGSNILGVTKTYKSFATLSYNNVGVNHTPFDYFGFSFNVEQQKERSYFAEKIIPETRFYNLLEDRRANINNQSFGNYNAIFKLKPKLSIKTNLYYLQDRINTNQLFKNQFVIENRHFTTSDNTLIAKKPQQYRGDFEIKYNISKTSLLEYSLRLRQENIETTTNVLQNQTNEFSTFLNTQDFYLKHDLLWTKKISVKSALQVSLFHSFNDLPQYLKISPSLLFANLKTDIQESNFQKKFVEGKVTYLGSGKRDKYVFILGANLNHSPFTSRLYNSENIISENNFDYTKNTIYNSGIYIFSRGSWLISPSYAIRVLNQKLKQNIENQKDVQNDFIIEPSLKIKYALNSISFLTTHFGYNLITNAEQYFFLNQVQINNRTAISNLPSLELQSSQRYSLLYFINDLYNQLQLNANISFQNSIGNFFSNQNINENTSQTEYFFLPQNSSRWSMNFRLTKYIPLIESTFKLTNNYSISDYKNIINRSDLRQNQSRFFRNSFFWKTAFDSAVNFENIFTYQYTNSKSESQKSFINKAWENTFKVIVKPNKKWFFIVSTEYFLPNTKHPDEQFFFLDASLRQEPKGKRWKASVSMRNITGEKNFEQVQTSDIATSVFKSNLLPRYFLLNLTWDL